jgi:hypothetical protein
VEANTTPDHSMITTTPNTPPLPFMIAEKTKDFDIFVVIREDEGRYGGPAICGGSMSEEDGRQIEIRS